MIWLARIFTWWNGQTINTALHTSLFGKFAGKDEFGNRAWLRAPVGDLRGRERRLDDPSRLVWLAASHGRYTANRRKLRRPPVGIEAPAEFDRYAASLASAGLDLGCQCAASGDR
jgi:hypothetical protein